MRARGAPSQGRRQTWSVFFAIAFPYCNSTDDEAGSEARQGGRYQYVVRSGDLVLGIIRKWLTGRARSLAMGPDAARAAQLGLRGNSLACS